MSAFGQRFENFFDRFAIKDRRRAAAEEYRFRLFCKFRQPDFANQPVDIGFIGLPRGHGNSERAVVAALLTERNVNVNARFHKL